MKTDLWAMRIGGVLIALPLLGGCAAQGDNAVKTNATSRAVSPAATNVAEKVMQEKIATAPVKQIAPDTISALPGVTEVIKLAESGVSEQVILAFVENSMTAYELSADDILYLYDQGLTAPVITAMIRRDNTLREQGAKAEGDKAQILETAELVKKALAEERQVAQPQVQIPVQPAPQPALDYAPAPVAPAPEYATATQPVYVNPYPEQVNNFYNSLSPYGSWMEVADYGWCWQPRAYSVNRSWRPYCDRGRWIYSNCGWYWQSDYSWGWAPFHYGRWVDHHSRGWMWSPDSVWAPAWVTWRVHDDYCGWAPLPPGTRFTAGVGFSYWDSHVGVSFGFGLSPRHYTFVPIRRFSDRHPENHIVAGSQLSSIYSKSTVINNVTVGNNHTIINEGIGYQRVAAATRAEIPKVTVRDLPPTAGKQVKPERVEREGSQLVVYRPQIQNQTPQAPSLAISRNQQELPKETGSRDPRAVISKAETIPSLAAPTVAKPGSERIARNFPASQPKAIESRNAGIANGESHPETLTSSQSATKPQSITPLGNPAPITTPTYRTQPARQEPQKQQASIPNISKPIAERGVPSQGSQQVLNSPQPLTSSATSPSYNQQHSTPNPAAQPSVQARPYIPERPAAAVTVPSYNPRQSVPQPSFRPEVRNPGYASPQPVTIPSSRPDFNASSTRQVAAPPPVQTPSYRSEPVRQAPSVSQPAYQPSQPSRSSQPSQPSQPSAPVSRSDSNRGKDNR